MADTAVRHLIRSPGYTENAEAFFRRLVWPEEERPVWTTAKWDGCNVVPFEKYRRPTKSQ
jgi:hypothetical protein